MTYKRYVNYLRSQDGVIGTFTSGPNINQLVWTQDEVNAPVNVGSSFVFRMMVDIPKNSTVNSAIFQAEYTVKDPTVLNQQFAVNAFLELNAEPYPVSNTSTWSGATGLMPPYPRKRPSWSSVNQTITYSSNTPGADYLYIGLQSQVQELVNHPEYEPGQSISVYLTVTLETYPGNPNHDIYIRMVDADSATADAPQLQVNFTEPPVLNETTRTDVNYIGNSDFEINSASWASHDAFGAYTTGTSVVRVINTARRGASSLRVTAGATDAAKGFMAYTTVGVSPYKSYVFCGWVYVPSTNPNPVSASFLYRGSPSDSITVKDQWVPFCTDPVVIPDDTVKSVFPALVSGVSSNPAYSFYADDLAMVESRHRIYPFDAGSTSHRRMEVKNFYQTGYPVIARKAPAHVSAHVQPFIVLDDLNTTTGWSVTGTGVTIDTFNGGVRVTTPLANTTYTLTFTPPGGYFRRKRYLVVNTETTLQNHPNLTKYSTDTGINLTSPNVVTTEAAGSGTRRFFDVGKDAGRLSSLTWQLTGTISGTRTFIIYDIGESDRLTAQPGLVTSSGYMLKDGLWARTTTERQSATFDDTETTSGHAQAGKTLGQLAAMNKKFDELEAV